MNWIVDMRSRLLLSPVEVHSVDANDGLIDDGLHVSNAEERAFAHEVADAVDDGAEADTIFRNIVDTSTSTMTNRVFIKTNIISRVNITITAKKVNLYVEHHHQHHFNNFSTASSSL